MSSGRLVILNYPIVVVYWEDNLVYCLREDLNLYYVISLENLFKHVSWFLEIVMPEDQHQCCILLWRGRENNLRPAFENIPIHDDHLYWFLFQLSWDAFSRHSRRKCLLHSSFCWVCPCLETWFNINEILSKTLSSLYSENFFCFPQQQWMDTLSWFWSCFSNNISIFFKSKKKKT